MKELEELPETIPENIRELLERQAAWQKRRAKLTWAEKVRMAAAVRESAAKWSRKGRTAAAPKRIDGKTH